MRRYWENEKEPAMERERQEEHFRKMMDQVPRHRWKSAWQVEVGKRPVWLVDSKEGEGWC